MKAREAHAIASKVDAVELAQIKSAIHKKAHEREFSMFWYSSISKPVIEELVLDGYKVDPYFDRNEEYYKISW
jgi:hypothetical protein